MSKMLNFDTRGILPTQVFNTRKRRFAFRAVLMVEHTNLET